MDALQILREDHEKLKGLFERIEEAEDDADRRSIFEELRDEILAHSFVEETVFYPAFSPFESFAELLEDSIDDHHEMKELLEEMEDIVPVDVLAGQDAESGEFLDQLEDLRDLVEEHIETEELELFPRVADVLNSEELERLGRLTFDAHAGAKRKSGRAA